MPTIKDVAREAGVSVGTVSRYLNGAVLKEQNQRKIDAAVARLGYRRNALARSMKTGRSMLVGVIVPALSNMFSMRVIEGVEHALEAHGFSVLVADSGGDAAREREKVALLRERMADGLVLMPCGENARAILRAAGKMPVALIDREMDERCFDSARRLGMIAGPETVQTARERRAGFLRALAESGLAPAAIVPGDYTVEGGNAGMRALLDAGVDAVFAANHELTVGALSLRDPRAANVRVLGFDGMELGDLCGERLTSLNQPMEEMGRAAAGLLLARIERPDAPIQSLRLPL